MAKHRYAFFPGCTLESAASELKIATLKTCERLGIEIQEIEGWTCCGAAQIQDIDDFLGVAVNARNIALAEAAGFDRILTVCNTCTLMLRTAKKRLDEDAALDRHRGTSRADFCGIQNTGRQRDHGRKDVKRHQQVCGTYTV